MTGRRKAWGLPPRPSGAPVVFQFGRNCDPSGVFSFRPLSHSSRTAGAEAGLSPHRLCRPRRTRRCFEAVSQLRADPKRNLEFPTEPKLDQFKAPASSTAALYRKPPHVNDRKGYLGPRDEKRRMAESEEREYRQLEAEMVRGDCQAGTVASGPAHSRALESPPAARKRLMQAEPSGECCPSTDVRNDEGAREPQRRERYPEHPWGRGFRRAHDGSSIARGCRVRPVPDTDAAHPVRPPSAASRASHRSGAVVGCGRSRRGARPRRDA